MNGVKRSGYALMAMSFFTTAATLGLAVALARGSSVLTVTSFAAGALLIASCVQLARAGVWPVVAVIAALMVSIETVLQLLVSAVVAARGPIVTAEFVDDVSLITVGTGLVEQLFVLRLVADTFWKWSLAALLVAQAAYSLTLLFSLHSGHVLMSNWYIEVSVVLGIANSLGLGALALLKFLHPVPGSEVS